MRVHPGRFQLLLFAILAGLSVFAIGPEKQNAKNAEALKKADTAFHAGVAARDAGKLDEAQAQFTTVVRLAPKIPKATRRWERCSSS